VEYTRGYLGGSQSGLTSGTWMRKRLVAMSVDTETSKQTVVTKHHEGSNYSGNESKNP